LPPKSTTDFSVVHVRIYISHFFAFNLRPEHDAAS
jgi:hypothetical protein